MSQGTDALLDSLERYRASQRQPSPGHPDLRLDGGARWLVAVVREDVLVPQIVPDLVEDLLELFGPERGTDGDFDREESPAGGMSPPR